LTASFDFVAQTTTDLHFDFTYNAYLRTALIDVLGVEANASVGWTITVLDLTAPDVFSWDISADDEWLVGTLGTTNPGDDIEFAFNGTVSESTTGGFLQQGNTYRLTITHEALADSHALVPEPLSLTLMGTGLLALAGIRRRRRTAA